MSDIDTLVVALSSDAQIVARSLRKSARPSVAVATEQEVDWAIWGAPIKIAEIAPNNVVFIVSEGSFLSSWLNSVLVLMIRARNGQKSGLYTYSPEPGIPADWKEKYSLHYRAMMLSSPPAELSEWLASMPWTDAAQVKRG